MQKIRYFIISIKNLIIWFPIIWKDRQWDSSYYEIILLKKIQLQRLFFEKRQYFVGWENEVRWMKYCEYLLTMLIKSKYWLDDWDNKYPSDNGLSSQNIKYKNLILTTINNRPKCYADLWEVKTRRLFWLIFVWRYRYWWD